VLLDLSGFLCTAASFFSSLGRARIPTIAFEWWPLVLRRTLEPSGDRATLNGMPRETLQRGVGSHASEHNRGESRVLSANDSMPAWLHLHLPLNSYCPSRHVRPHKFHLQPVPSFQLDARLKAARSCSVHANPEFPISTTDGSPEWF